MSNNSTSITTALQTLKKYFSYDSFRSPQAEIIQSVLEGQDTLVVLPTGGGKSLCYQIPGLIFTGQTLVITPLLSLMEDQVQALERKNISATYLSSSLNKNELQNRLQNISSYKFIYLTPERLVSRDWQKISTNLNIDLVAIDEAHCISEWGHDFRPPYLDIATNLQNLKKPPTKIALTATATPQTRIEICRKLKLNGPKIFTNSPYRSNLSLFLYSYHNQISQEINLFLLLNKHQYEDGIIYATTREKTEYIAQLIAHYLPKIKVAAYHAGLDKNHRSQIQADFLSGKISLIVATTAFGMGVDKPNIRFVIHYGPSTSIENYYQEIGRAGRDQQPANCYLLYRREDWLTMWSLISQNNTPQTKVRQLKAKQLLKLFTTKNCLHDSLNHYFSTHQTYKRIHCQQCQLCQPKTITISPELKTKIEKLKNWRRQQTHSPHIPPITDQVIVLTAILSPKSTNQLRKIAGVGQNLANLLANDIIHTI